MRAVTDFGQLVGVEVNVPVFPPAIWVLSLLFELGQQGFILAVRTDPKELIKLVVVWVGFSYWREEFLSLSDDFPWHKIIPDACIPSGSLEVEDGHAVVWVPSLQDLAFLCDVFLDGSWSQVRRL